MFRELDAVSAVWHSLMGGKFRVRLSAWPNEPVDTRPGHRFGDVLDEDGTVIGSAHDSTYGGRGFVVHTKPYGGFVPCDQIEFVE